MSAVAHWMCLHEPPSLSLFSFLLLIHFEPAFSFFLFNQRVNVLCNFLKPAWEGVVEALACSPLLGALRTTHGVGEAAAACGLAVTLKGAPHHQRPVSCRQQRSPEDHGEAECAPSC